jgi:hypothetical protein
MSNNFQIPGTETQQMLDKLKKELPKSSGGSAGIVFEANGDSFSPAAQDAVAAALAKLQTLPDVQGTVDPFATQAQLDKAAADLADGEQQATDGRAQPSRKDWASKRQPWRTARQSSTPEPRNWRPAQRNWSWANASSPHPRECALSRKTARPPSPRSSSRPPSTA